ncbi:hypothetical protein ASE36_03510 [Rhizobium sp. Root274]|uniref:hypothetical protein n=1 Tax=unclassified Rhizobium TaxID=2613769 RepID=UPI00071328FD|nr:MULTISPECIES: hypothetical protein [unclassified Rhizobium]KQW31339.1 hypothetical protein ASC71_03510 [Rhizobium sp. Root1240]KRD32883.1 hypothetical protein ASE36_03510 [Rhizobium sp. Root274]
MIESSITEYLNNRHSAVAQSDSPGGFLGTRLFQLILFGDAKLPLDRVEKTAVLLDCNKHELFRMAMRQFYDEQTISTFQKMLGCSISDEEQQWLDVIHSASDGPVVKPSAIARRLARALAKPPTEA